MITWVVVREGRVRVGHERQAAVDPGGDLLGVVARKPRQKKAGGGDYEGHDDADAEQVHRPAADVQNQPESEETTHRDGDQGRKVDDDVVGLEGAKGQIGSRGSRCVSQGSVVQMRMHFSGKAANARGHSGAAFITIWLSTL